MLALLLKWLNYYNGDCFYLLTYAEATDVVILHHFKSYFQITNGGFVFTWLNYCNDAASTLQSMSKQLIL